LFCMRRFSMNLLVVFCFFPKVLIHPFPSTFRQGKAVRLSVPLECVEGFGHSSGLTHASGIVLHRYVITFHSQLFRLMLSLGFFCSATLFFFFDKSHGFFGATPPPIVDILLAGGRQSTSSPQDRCRVLSTVGPQE